MEELFEIMKKPKNKYNIKLGTTDSVYKLKEIQAIKDAVQEHLVFIGLDQANNVRNISLLGIGSGKCINIDSKFIVRTALISACEKVILVHNHPSNSLKPSKEDIHLTTVTNRLLKVFHIQLIDHIIVTENEYLSMGRIAEKNLEEDSNLPVFLDKGLLVEEIERLKTELNELKQSMESEEDYEM
jgi:DNA repair protein RadC